MSDSSRPDIWILGATGNIGKALVARLDAQGVTGVVVIGRSGERLESAFRALEGRVDRRVLPDLGSMIAAVSAERPRIIVNLMGSYAETAVPLAMACMPSGCYVDLSIDNSTLADLVDLHELAKRAESTIVGGAGFGVLATEALVVRLCDGMPTPSRVDIDALSSYSSQDGTIGDAFAVTSVDVMTIGGRAYRNGRLVPVPLASNLRRHVLPDGTTVTSAAVPSGELFAAHVASGSPSIDFTSALAPTAPLVRAVLPLLSRLLKAPSIRRTMIRRMAAVTTKQAPRPRPYSWGHAVVEWPDGTIREGWLRAEDAMDFTADVLTVVVRAMLAGTAPIGAFTPAAAFGAALATDAGATFVETGPGVFGSES